jgi:hypothetical protein
MRLYLLTAAFFIFVQVAGQEVKFESTMGWRGGGVELYSIVDKQKQQNCLLVEGSDSIRAFLFNNKAELIKQFAFDRSMYEEIRGGFINDGKIYVFINNTQFDRLQNRVVNISTGEVTKHKVDFDLKKDRLLTRISRGDHFLYVTVNNRNSELVLYDFSNESTYKTFRHKFSDNDWKILNKARGGLSLEYVNDQVQYDAFAAGVNGKAFIVKDTLYLLLNYERNTTDIFSFDLVNDKMQYRSIKHEGLENVTSPQYFAETSYLLDDRLYYVHATGATMNLQIFDFYTGKAVKEYSVKKDEDISFKNTPIVRNYQASPYQREREKDFEKPVQLFRKMLSGLPVVLPFRREDGLVELAVGAYEVQIKSGAQSDGGGRPVRKQDLYGLFSSFRMLTNPVTGENIPGDLKKTISEKIENYTNDARFSAEAYTFFMLDNQYYHAYYDRKERKLVVVKY